MLSCSFRAQPSIDSLRGDPHECATTQLARGAYVPGRAPSCTGDTAWAVRTDTASFSTHSCTDPCRMSTMYSATGENAYPSSRLKMLTYSNASTHSGGHGTVRA